MEIFFADSTYLNLVLSPRFLCRADPVDITIIRVELLEPSKGFTNFVNVDFEWTATLVFWFLKFLGRTITKGMSSGTVGKEEIKAAVFCRKLHTWPT